MSKRERPLNLREIEVLRAIMLAGSATDAAKVLRISQPAVSRLLRCAESRLGVPLFDRIKGRLHPTPQARTLYHEVEAAYRGVLRVQDMALELAAGGAAHLRVIAHSSLGLALVPRAIAAIRRRANGLRVSLETRPQSELVDSIAGHDGDLGVALSPAHHPAVVADTLAEGGLVCIAPDDHPLADLDEIRATDLSGVPLISFDRATVLGRAIDDAFITDRVSREIAIEVASTPIAAALVMQGAGVAVVEAFAIPAGALPGIVARRFASSARFDLSLLRSRSHGSSAAATALAAELRHQISVPQQPRMKVLKA